jgi:hypothetical protein
MPPANGVNTTYLKAKTKARKVEREYQPRIKEKTEFFSHHQKL